MKGTFLDNSKQYNRTVLRSIYNGTAKCYKHFLHYYHHLYIIHLRDEILKFALWVPQSNNDILALTLKDKLNKYVQIISNGYESID